MHDLTIPDYIAERIRRPPPAECPVVPGATPVIAFGPFRSAKVATLGLNPSKREFLDTHGHELAGEQRRLETLAALGIRSLVDAPDAVVTQVLAGCNGYFQRNPYKRWFDQLQRILDASGVSYADGSAVHLDLVQWATDPIWRHLNRTVIERLLREDTAFLRQQLAHEQLGVLLLNGRSVINHFEWAFNTPLKRVPDRLYSGAVATELVIGSLGACTVIGWSTNIQSSFGVTRELRHTLAETVARLIDQARVDTRKATLKALVAQHTHPPLEHRRVLLEGTTTIDGPEIACRGQIRLKRYADHIFAHWGINRMNGSLPAYEGVTIPLSDLAPGDDVWGASVQVILDHVHAYTVHGVRVFAITSWAWQIQSFDPGDVKQIIELLTLAITHKGMVLGGANLEKFLEWHMGFSQGVGLAGLTIERTPESRWWTIVKARGWQPLAMQPWREMRERGMSDEAIINEILTIDIETWKQTYQITEA